MLNRIFKVFDGLLDRAFSVVGAAAFSQVPEYMQQYLQRLGGHLDEAQRQVELIRRLARSSGRTLNDYIDKLLVHDDLDVVRQGEMVLDMIDRAADLRDGMEAIQSAAVFTKPFVFLTRMEPGIAKAAIQNFKPAVPITLENIAYAFIGVFFGLALYHLVVKSPLALVRKPRRRPATLRR